MHTEYRQRRSQLLEKLGTSTAIFRSAPQAVMHNDVEYHFRQDSAFYYLTGCNEPDAVAVFAPHHETHPFVMFVRPKDIKAETWSGRRTGVELAKQVWGADEVFSITELDEKLPEYLKKADRIYYHLGHDEAFNTTVIQHWRKLMRGVQKHGVGPIALEDSSQVLDGLRLVKSEAELALMRRAVAIAAEAHNFARTFAQVGHYEWQIQAEMEYIFRKRGALGPAYPSIVASGENACILHYVENNCQIGENELLLIDAGCSVDYYNSDITRTFPVSGQFTEEQGILYDLVLKAQKAAIAQVQPGHGFNRPHDTAVSILVDGLLELGLLTGNQEEIIKEEKYKHLYMHRTGHWLGLDVHDVGSYKHNETEWRQFQAGQVVTVEPGVYISPTIESPEGQPEIPQRWRGIGIRIEDDVLVTATGHEVLSGAIPKERAELER
ncbi:MAG: M24 family metallopeptidase [Synechococcales cyanobacterium RU_4_20]|nr:M24 family metallopeptidase [Synechococcales cyanobacterium RU_4_20]NJR68913.1 M24 family metallopeptidase [Synechococcales cyanobacterium CRU_2_2]